jgi:2-polyprenyl-3-methyl-5-hydroxy-6-metoxy-1,4-benzoquinol methylase
MQQPQSKDSQRINTQVSCHVCGFESFAYALKDGFTLYKCPSCLLVFVYPQPTQQDLAQNVYSSNVGYQANKIKDISKVKVTKAFSKVLNFMDSVQVGSTQSGSNAISALVCDIGASNGEFLFAARKRGYKTCGVELNASTAAVANSNNLNVFVGTLADAQIKEGSCDIVHMGDVIEHVPSPRDLLLQVRTTVHPQGYIIISTPNLNCYWARCTQLLYKLFNIPISSFTPPHHLFQFSDSNLDTLFKELGFSVVTRWYNKRPSLGYELGALHIFKNIRSARGLMKIKACMYVGAVYAVYTGLYITAEAVSLLIPKFKDFSMVTAAQPLQPLK